MSGRRKILVCDNDANVRRLLAVALDRRGFEVSLATDGVEAMAHMHGQVFDFVLLDVVMPRMDGLEVLKEMRDDPLLRETPVVIMSVKSGDDDISEACLAGADFYLPKPFSVSAIAELIAC